MKFIDCLKERTTFDFAENELIVTNVNLYKKTKTIELFLKIKSILRPNDFKALHHEVMSILTPLGLDSVILNVEYENKNLDDSLANEYYNAIMLSLSEKNLVFKCFLDLKHIYSDGLFTVTIDRESVFLNEYLPQIKQSFNKAFLNVDFKLEVDESLKTLSEIQQEEMKQTISLMEHQERKAEEEQHKREVVNLKPDYRKKVEVSSLSKINEIPQTQEGIFTYREQSGEPNFMVEGEIFSLDLSKKKVSYLLKIEIFDDTDSICVNKWVRENELQAAEALKIGDIVNVQGKAEYNTFQHEVTIQASSLNFVSHADHKSSRTDNAQVKRVELHMHTKMSNLDGLNEAADIVKTVTSWGHKAIAFTDRNGVYAIPDINHATEKNPDFKPIYGCELDYIDDYIFDGVYLLFAEDGVNVVDEDGHPNLQYVYGKFWLNNHAHIMQGNDIVSTEYLYLALKESIVIHLVTGAAQPKINQENMSTIPIIVPPQIVMQQFNQKICLIFNYKKLKETENIELIRLQSLLLAKMRQ